MWRGASQPIGMGAQAGGGLRQALAGEVCQELFYRLGRVDEAVALPSEGRDDFLGMVPQQCGKEGVGRLRPQAIDGQHGKGEVPQVECLAQTASYPK